MLCIAVPGPGIDALWLCISGWYLVSGDGVVGAVRWNQTAMSGLEKRPPQQRVLVPSQVTNTHLLSGSEDSDMWLI